MGLLSRVITRLTQLIVPPKITSVTPNAGSPSGSTSLTIAGTGFKTGATVYIKDSAGVNRACTSVVVVGPTSITCVSPLGAAGIGLLQLRNRDGGGTTSPYTYEAAPTVSAITPNTGTTAGGTAITNLAGTGFLTGALVSIGGAAATSVVVVSATQITCVTPARTSGAKNVVVTNLDGQTSGTSGNGLFTYS